MVDENIKYPKTPEGDTSRITNAARRCRQVLETKVAQRDDAPRLGMTFNFDIVLNRRSADAVWTPTDFGLPEIESLAYTANKARPFSLQNDEIMFTKVRKSLRNSPHEEWHSQALKQIVRMWEDAPFPRYTHFKSVDGVPVLPEGDGPGVATNALVGNKYFYSEIGHSHDASHILDHIDTPLQLQDFAGLVGDWMAIVAHQELLIHEIRPDICPELTQWAGDPETIYMRLDVHRPDTESENTVSV